MGSTFLLARPNDVTFPPNLFEPSITSDTSNLFWDMSSENGNGTAETLFRTEFETGLNRTEFESFTSASLLAEQMTDHVTVFINFLLSFIICGGNILTVTAICKSHKLQTQPNFYIASLAGADIMMGVIVFVRGFSYIQETHSVFTFSPFACLIFLSLLYTSMAASIFSLVLVSLDRVINTNFCLLYESMITPRMTKVLIFATWILAVVYGTVPIYTSHYPSRLRRCIPTQVLTKAYFLHVNSVTFLVSSLVIIVCYLQIARIFLQHRKKIMQTRPGAIRPEMNRAGIAESRADTGGPTGQRRSRDGECPHATHHPTIKIMDTQDKNINPHRPEKDDIELEINPCAINRGYHDDTSQSNNSYEIPKKSLEDIRVSGNGDSQRDIWPSTSKNPNCLSENQPLSKCKDVKIDTNPCSPLSYVSGEILSDSPSSETEQSCSISYVRRLSNSTHCTESSALPTGATPRDQITPIATHREALDTTRCVFHRSTSADNLPVSSATLISTICVQEELDKISVRPKVDSSSFTLYSKSGLATALDTGVTSDPVDELDPCKSSSGSNSKVALEDLTHSCTINDCDSQTNVYDPEQGSDRLSVDVHRESWPHSPLSHRHACGIFSAETDTTWSVGTECPTQYFEPEIHTRSQYPNKLSAETLRKHITPSLSHEDHYKADPSHVSRSCHSHVPDNNASRSSLDNVSGRGSNAPVTGQDIPSRLRAARLLGTVCGIFLVCWTPLMFSVLAFYTMGGTFEAISACTTLAVINSAVNFFIYAVANSDFRQAFKRLLCRR